MQWPCSSTPALTSLIYDGADRTKTITPSGGTTLTATYAGPDTTERHSFGSTTFQVGAYSIKSDTAAGIQHWFETDPPTRSRSLSPTAPPTPLHLGNISGMMGDKGYIGNGMLMPIRKPPYRETHRSKIDRRQRRQRRR